MIPNCRDCPGRMRTRCIDQSATSPSVKMMMHRAFSAGTDTQEMWGLLQMNCLLAPQKGKTAEPAPAKPRVDVPEPIAVPKQPPGMAPASAARPRSSPVRAERPIQPAAADRKAEEAPSRYCLALQGGRHRIALVESGQILLGRFDPAALANPDVDLSFDDRESRVISRRHARVIGYEGNHLIEDLGSTNGTRVNGERLKIGQKVLLQLDDRVILGNREFLYRPISRVGVSSSTVPEAYLWVTFTGHRFSLPSRGEVIVGRSDPVVGSFPDIDLGEEGEAAQVVARRHVRISASNSRHYMEDLGSANGTRLNGRPIGIGERGLLEPGDHLWLGGCVLAYDVEL